MTHNNHPKQTPALGETRGVSPDQRTALAKALGGLGTFGGKLGKAAAGSNSNLARPEGIIQRMPLQEALRYPSMRQVVQWNDNPESEGVSHTVHLEKPGTVVPADLLRGYALIVTDEQGRRTATDFAVAAELPELSSNGKFVRVDEKGDKRPLNAWSADKVPMIRQDLVVGEPWNGSRIKKIAITGDAFADKGNGLGGVVDFDNPNVQVDAPDPTFYASDLLDEAHERLGV